MCVSIPDDVVVEEVGVQERLNQGRKVQQGMVLVVSLRVRAIHPVEDVKRPVCAQQEHIVPCFSRGVRRGELGKAGGRDKAGRGIVPVT